MAYTVSRIIETVNKRTQNRSQGDLDMNTEFWAALAEFCNEKHYWWRQKTAFFNTSIGTREYDLNDSGVADGADDFDEAISFNSFSTAGVFIRALAPILDEQTVQACLLGTDTDEPTRFFVRPGHPQVISLGSPASVVVKIGATYWATPTPSDEDDTNDDEIPLVPPSLHYGLIACLERRVWRALIAEDDPRYMSAEREYQAFLARADRKRSWTGQETLNIRATGRGIRATR